MSIRYVVLNSFLNGSDVYDSKLVIVGILKDHLECYSRRYTHS